MKNPAGKGGVVMLLPLRVQGPRNQCVPQSTKSAATIGAAGGAT